MIITKGVILGDLKPEIIRVIPVLKAVIETMYFHLHIIRGFVETETMTGHHACGLAVDFRSNLWPMEWVIKRLKSLLGNDYEIKQKHGYIHLAFIGTVSFFDPPKYWEAFNHITKGVKNYGWS